MVLKMKDNIKNPSISKFCTKTLDNLWKFDYGSYMKFQYPSLDQSYLDIMYWNKEYENILNGPELYLCNRCGIPDYKENLDKGVEHSKIQCEEANYHFKIYKSLSDDCRENPGKSKNCLDELSRLKNEIKFRDNTEQYKYYNFLLKYETGIVNDFDIKKYNSDNKVSQKWLSRYFYALKKIKPESEK